MLKLQQRKPTALGGRAPVAPEWKNAARRYIPAGLSRVSMPRKDLHRGTLSLVDQAVVSGTSFVTSVIVGRLGSDVDLGIFFLALTLVYFVRGIQDQLICAPYAVYCQGRRDEALAFYSGSSFLHHLVISAVAMVVLAAMWCLLSMGFGPSDLRPAVGVLLGALPFLQLREFIRRLSIAQLHLGTAIAIDLAVAALQIGGLLGLARLGLLSVASAYLTMAVACAVASLAWYVSRRHPLRFALSRAALDWKSNWGFARWAITSHLIGFSTLYITPWIVNALRGSGDAGVLAACITVAGIASMFLTGLATFLIPRAALAYSRGAASELKRVLRTAAAVYGLVLGGFALFVFATGDFLLVLAFGTEYAGYGTVSGVVALGTAVLSMGLVAGAGLWAIDEPQANLAADIGTLVVTLALVLFLLPSFGVLGAALGDLGGKIAGVIVRQATLYRLLKAMPYSLEAI